MAKESNIGKCKNNNCPPHSFQDEVYRGERVFTGPADDRMARGQKRRCTVCNTIQ